MTVGGMISAPAFAGTLTSDGILIVTATLVPCGSTLVTVPIGTPSTSTWLPGNRPIESVKCAVIVFWSPPITPQPPAANRATVAVPATSARRRRPNTRTAACRGTRPAGPGSGRWRRARAVGVDVGTIAGGVAEVARRRTEQDRDLLERRVVRAQRVEDDIEVLQ